MTEASFPTSGLRAKSTLLALIALLLALVQCVGAIPPSRAASVDSVKSLNPRGQIAGGKLLRVLPIGDSITWGAQSSDLNGYRKTLYDKLVALGNSVDFVGGEHTGTGTGWDMDHEGHRAYVITQIQQASGVGIASGPNIVLLHAGTNDMNRNIDVNAAPDRLKAMMDEIHRANPHAVFLLCQIIPAPNPDTHARINTFNQALADITPSWIKGGLNIILVPMSAKLSLSDIKDDLHPNDGGYIKMADAFYDAILQADAKGWIQTPDPPSKVISSGCKDTPAWHHYGLIADGAKVAHDDGPFVPGFVNKGQIINGKCPGGNAHFPDLTGDGFADYVCVSSKNASVQLWTRYLGSDGKPSGGWHSIGTVASGDPSRLGPFVSFADLNGDKMDDYIYLDYNTRDVYAWINRGQGSDGTWNWQELGKIGNTHVPIGNSSLQMADINGDGRADFLITDLSTGVTTAWLNAGAEIIPDYYGIGVIATGATATVNDIVIFADVTGEGRADYLLLGQTGKVTGFVNRVQEKSLVPGWSQPLTIAAGPTGANKFIVAFADMTGDGKADYLLVDSKTGDVTLYENTGTGGKYQAGEGVFLCDLDGDGISDYFWLDPTGKGYGYLNTGHGTNNWQPIGQITSGDHPRELVRMGRMTTSGRADYIVLDPLTGAAQWYLNTGKDGNWQYSAQGVLATGPWKTIQDQFEWQFRVENVRFADLDGDGLDDYLYVHEQGYVVMWKNLNTNPVSWSLPHLVASPKEHVLSPVVHFADTNGDGAVDYVVIGQETGSARVWWNLGPRDDESINWREPVPFADGTGPGAAIRLAYMTGDRRADWVSINPETGSLDLWKNACWGDPDQGGEPTGGGGGGGDDGGDGNDSGDDWDALSPCHLVTAPPTLDELKNDRSSYPDHCIPVYTLASLVSLSNQLLQDYSLDSEGYDKEFTSYQRYVKNAIASTLKYNFMYNISAMPEGQQAYYPKYGDGMKYFQCQSPPTYRNWRACSFAPMSTAPISFRASDGKGYKQALADLGMLTDWTDLGDTDLPFLHYDSTKKKDINADPPLHGFPILNSSIDIPNPQKVASKAIPKLQQLIDPMTFNICYMLAGLWVGGDARDVSTGFAPPVFLLQQAIDDMEQVTALGIKEDEIEKEAADAKHKALILLIVGIVLTFVPVIGEEAAGLAGFAVLKALIGVFGDAAGQTFDLYTIVDDPQGAIMTYFNLFIGVSNAVTRTVRFTGGQYSEAVAHLLKDAIQVENYSAKVSEGMGLVNDIGQYIHCHTS